MNPGPRLAAQLQALQRAQDAGAAAEAARIRAQIVEERLIDGALESEPEFLDVVLLDRLATDLQDSGRHEAALGVLSAARSAAAKRSDELWVRRLELHAVASCIGLRDFDAATHVMRGLLGLPADVALWDSGAVAAVASLSPARAEASDLRELRIEAMSALGRLRAALGRFDAAAKALLATIALMDGRGSRWISASDVELLLAEVFLDCGDFHRFDGLAATHGEDESSNDFARWELLRGSACRLLGRLSEAERRFADVIRIAGSRDARIARMARWQRVQALATLNRMDEAEAECAALAVDADPPLDVETIGRMLAARRGTASVQLDANAAPAELLSENVDAGWLPLAGQSAPGVEAPVREHESVRDDWARLGWIILLDVHAGRIAEARARLAMLAQWCPDVDSRPLRARYDRLAAIVAYYARDFATALTHIDRARAVYDAASMLSDAAEASRLRVWILRAASAPDVEIDAEVERTRAAMERITRAMSPVDRILFRLNKWSTVDDAIAVWCRALHATPSGPRDTYATLRRAISVKLWSWERGSDASNDDTPQRSGAADVFRLAEEFARKRADAGEVNERRAPLHPRLLPRDTAVLCYVSLPDSIEAFLVQRGRCELLPRRPGATRINMLSAVQSAVTALARGGCWLDLRERLRPLSSLLRLDDAMARLDPGIRRLAIIPDDAVEHAPFAALPVGDAPLVALIAPSLVPTPRWRRRRAWPRQVPSAFAVDMFSGTDDARKITDEFTELSSFSVAPLRVLHARQATRAEVGRSLRESAAAHLACHGAYDPDNPLQSGLELADGSLTVRDLRGLRFGGNHLIVLGSCWSGNAAMIPGRAMIGLPTALLDAGAVHVVSSLWELFDSLSPDDLAAAGGKPSSPTAAFMRDLYAGLRVQPPDLALATVQRAWATTRSASDWAGYQSYQRAIELAPLPSFVAGALRLL